MTLIYRIELLIVFIIFYFCIALGTAVPRGEEIMQTKLLKAAGIFIIISSSWLQMSTLKIYTELLMSHTAR